VKGRSSFKYNITFNKELVHLWLDVILSLTSQKCHVSRGEDPENRGEQQKPKKKVSSKLISNIPLK